MTRLYRIVQTLWQAMPGRLTFEFLCAEIADAYHLIRANLTGQEPQP